jgi:hypothetical protein
MKNCSVARTGTITDKTINGTPLPLVAPQWPATPSHGPRRWAAWYALFAAFAAGVALFSGPGRDRWWGSWAAGGYAAAGVLAVTWPTRWGRLAALAAALAGALAGPTVWLATRIPATPDVRVVTRAAMLALHHGAAYLPPSQVPHSPLAYNPYLPFMAIFGLPRALGLTGLAGDTRTWLVLATAAALAAAFGISTPHRAWRCAGCRWSVLTCTGFLVTSPMLAMPLAVGITDPPMIALVCLALAATCQTPGRRLLAGQRGQVLLAGLAIGAACAMKATAWPALPVIAAMLTVRDGTRAAAWFAVTAALTAGALIVAAAPALVTSPAALYQNIVAFPLGLTSQKTPAASPLPGHLLASTGHLGQQAAIALLVLAGLAVAASLVLRPPGAMPDATLHLAVGLTILFTLAPATRFGYFNYPAALLCWLALTRYPQAITEPGPAAIPLPVSISNREREYAGVTGQRAYPGSLS